MNIIDQPIHRLEDRRAFLNRVLTALLKSDDCRFDFKGPWRHLAPEEEGNWQARQDMANLLADIPASPAACPSATIPTEHVETVDEATV